MTAGRVEDPFAARLVQAVPIQIRRAALVCAVPHSVDRDLGSALVMRFAATGHRAELTLTEVLGLPFVCPVEDGRWQYAATARQALMASLIESQKDFSKVSRFLTRYLSRRPRAATGDVDGKNDRWEREREWERAYHQIVTDPDGAVERMFRFAEAAGEAGREGDLRAVVQSWDERDRWLREFEVERSYFRGRLAYVTRDWREAESHFRVVWDRGAADPLMTATAGFLLAVVRRQSGTTGGVREAEVLLRRVLAMSTRQRRGAQKSWRSLRGKALNSLAGTLVQRSGRRARPQVRALLDESEKIARRDKDATHRAHVLHTRGTLLSRSADPKDLDRAMVELEGSLRLAPPEDQRHRAQVLNSLGQVMLLRGGYGSRVRAEKLIRQSVRIGRHLGDDQHVANALHTLGTVLLESGRLGKAAACFAGSARLWNRLENREGEGNALRAFATVLKRRGRTGEAARVLRSVAKLERQKKAT